MKKTMSLLQAAKKRDRHKEYGFEENINGTTIER